MEENTLQEFVAGLTPEELTYLLYLRRDKKHYLYSASVDYHLMKS